MAKLLDKVARLYEEGYTLTEIAETLNISESKAQKILDELEEVHEETPSMAVPTRTPLQEKSHQRKLKRALDSLKEDYDEIILAAAEADGDTIEREQFDSFLESVRDLEYRFRKVAKDYGFSVEENPHREMLLELITELKGKREDFDEEDDTLELDIDEDLLEEADDLRFELVEFSEA